MATKIDQKAYLQKYLGGPPKDKKKKKKKSFKGKGLNIIDHDVDISKIRMLEGDELDILDQGEDGPQIAGIIDERPEEIKKLEQFQTSTKWKIINQDDGFNSKLNIEEIKKDIKEVEKENEVVFGKMYSDSEDEKQDSDASPPRKNTKSDSKSEKVSKTQTFDSAPRRRQCSDSDVSPPRKGGNDKSGKNRSEADFSPPRRETKRNDDSDISPPRKSGNEKSGKRNKADFSPPRRRELKRNDDSDVSPPRKHESVRENKRERKRSRWGSVERQKTPERRKEKSKRKSSPQRSDSDSRPRKSRKDYDSDELPPRRSRKESPKGRKTPDSDLSPPRKGQRSPVRKNLGHKNDKYENDYRNKRSKSSDSDISPPRKTHKNRTSPINNRNQSKRRDNRKLSPDTRDNRKRQNETFNRRKESDSDESPPRRDKRKSDSPPPSNKRMEKTLEGKMAGLQDARQLRNENDAFRKREEDAFKRLGDEVSGRNAQVVSRKSKRETSEERQQQKDKAERQKVLDEKYKRWTKGVKQLADQEARTQDYLHEAAKPLARHKDDRDLEHSLKQVERAGDPMLKYIREKKRERGELAPERPSFKGDFPPNRFNIRPGYRWDGVDRSNGYEKKYFEQQSKRKAQQEEAYKWSTEDL